MSSGMGPLDRSVEREEESEFRLSCPKASLGSKFSLPEYLGLERMLEVALSPLSLSLLLDSEGPELYCPKASLGSKFSLPEYLGLERMLEVALSPLSLSLPLDLEPLDAWLFPLPPTKSFERRGSGGMSITMRRPLVRCVGSIRRLRSRATTRF